MRSGRIKFAGVGFSESTNIAGEFNASRLHSETNAKVGNLVFAGITDALQHSSNAAFAEPTGHEDAVEPIQLLFVTVVRSFQTLGLDPLNDEFEIELKRGMNQRFLQ